MPESFYAKITPVGGSESPIDPDYGQGRPLPPMAGHPLPIPPLPPGAVWPPPGIVAPPIHLPPVVAIPPIYYPEGPPSIGGGPIVPPDKPGGGPPPSIGGGPIIPPEKPNLPPGSIWPPLNPGDGISGKIIAVVWLVGIGYRWAALDVGNRPVAPDQPPQPKGR